MASSCCGKRPRPAVPLLLVLLVVSCSSVSASGGGRGNSTRTTEFRSGDELREYQSILAKMDKMKKASVKTIQASVGFPSFACACSSCLPVLKFSPSASSLPLMDIFSCAERAILTLHSFCTQSSDGDVIHCVPAHLQPAFDHPTLRGQKPEPEPEERPKTSADAAEEEGDAVFPQAWSDTGESCPGGTHAVGYVTGDQFYGAKASLNVWPARVASAAEFSLSQIWVISGTFGNDLNTIEAGWQVSPQLYGDNSPRFFTYWTSDAYQATGCYNLHCSGFVQTNRRIAIGAAISPASAYNGRQFDISLLIWKDPRRGHWWLQLGSGPLVGYWPSSLFSHLGGHANMVQFGGEVVNTRPSGSHTPTQMGSGHFPREGFNRAAYFRNVQVVDWDNNLLPARDLRLVADHPACYGIQGGYNRAWGNYFYYGGPGRNVHCP
ncbi:hypothetical protein TRIUR3_27507 [Triticum urartu]|uniref:Neprosin PEP catalytic domain-containing protein n=1 Tax=Triticum urartu TaxID=4572 RepID=M7ZTU6_TRIUA|nr:hypothetical protein TRIUR3_27507 [Triticum urartu]